MALCRLNVWHVQTAYLFKMAEQVHCLKINGCTYIFSGIKIKYCTAASFAV
ncbi:hypothetical protein NEICINOT_03640 [Neisseria cinerea ATCC 14685]|uniref:Uncharacterized protein n=1 Tax=Neisseria cinerea ATCC 14685 TaxID=546262 RepID=D0W1W2_NEICI|nr:hypothetical protein NEICINOT_03640 [Neisseria cinerea ATCC 14685]